MAEMKSITLNGRRYEMPMGTDNPANLHVWKINGEYVCSETPDAYSRGGYEYLGRLGDAFEGGSDLPEYTEADYGKVLTCTSGGFAWVDASAALPDAEEASF